MRATEKLGRAQETISTLSRDLVNIAQLKPLTTDMKRKVASYEATKRDLKDELAKVKAESTPIFSLLDGIFPQVAEL